jgi:hypothetical protein
LADKWRLVEPFEDRGSSEQIGELLRKLRVLSAEKFYDQPQDLQGKVDLSTPELTVNLFKKGDKELLGVELWSTSGEQPETLFRLVGQPTVYSASGAKLGELLLRLDKAVDLRLFDLFTTELKEISFDLNGTKTTLDIPVGGEWKVDGQPAERPIAESYLNELVNLQLDGVLLNHPVNPEQFETLLKISYQLEQGRSESILISPSKPISLRDLGISPQVAEAEGKATQSVHLVLRQGSQKLFWLSEDNYSKLIPKAEALRAVVQPTLAPTK